MSYKLLKKLDNGVRIGELETLHGKIETPFFMPVGTVGSVKGMAPWELEEMGAQIVLSNTYHLYLRPGERVVKSLGGLHQFMGWNKPILTDSGGYQVFSLGREKTNDKFLISNDKSNSKLQIPNVKKESLVKITEDGVEFKSHLDGSKHLFTPEKVIDIQLDLGVDILMPLDVCPSGKATRAEVEKAVELTIKWAKRAKKHFDRKLSIINGPSFAKATDGKQLPINYQLKNDQLEQNILSPGFQISSLQSGMTNNNKLTASRKLQTANSVAQRPLLHGIVQGGMDLKLRKYCAEELMKLDFDGYSIGGLAVDLETREMWDVVKYCCDILPEDKQRYLMGVGTPDDIIKATQCGVDMFDCVLPTRLARHGSVYVKCQNPNNKCQKFELLNLLNSKFRTDKNVIDESCGCRACQNGRGFSRAYIAHLLRSNEILGLRLATMHNLWQYLELMRELRKS